MDKKRRGIIFLTVVFFILIIAFAFSLNFVFTARAIQNLEMDELACETAEFKWTGTKCCGNDAYEFYSDYLEGSGNKCCSFGIAQDSDAVGLGNGDTRFFCYNGQWYANGWEEGWNSLAWLRKAEVCDLIGGFPLASYYSAYPAGWKLGTGAGESCNDIRSKTCDGNGNCILGQPDIKRVADFNAENPLSSFSFVVYGDAHSSATHSTVVNSIIRLNPKPKFIVSLGDTTETASDSNWATFMSQITPFVLTTPETGLPSYYFPCIGNREKCSSKDNSQSAYCKKVRDNFPFLNTLQNPDRSGASSTEIYYSFSYGDSYFIVLNSGNSPGTIGAEQTVWFKEQLAKANANSFENIFVFNHHSPYMASDTTCGNSLKKLVNELSPEKKITAWFSGHNHAFFDIDCLEYEDCGNTEFFIVATGGAGLKSSNKCTLSKYSGDAQVTKFISSHGFAVISVNENLVELSFFNENGNLLYTDTIK